MLIKLYGFRLLHFVLGGKMFETLKLYSKGSVHERKFLPGHCGAFKKSAKASLCCVEK